MSCVKEHEEAVEVLPIEDVVPNHTLKLLPYGFRDLREAVAREVDKVPRLINEEMVDELCFSRCGRDLSQPILLGKHIDEGGLADVGTPNEGHLWAVGGGALLPLLAAANKTCCDLLSCIHLVPPSLKSNVWESVLSPFLKTARRYGKKVMGLCGGHYRRFELPFCAVKKSFDTFAVVIGVGGGCTAECISLR